MIILIIPEKSNTFLQNIKSHDSHYSQRILQSNYDDILSKLDLSKIKCSCGSHDWNYHGHYTRKVTISSWKEQIKITRIICCECGKTQTILLEGMVPFSSFLASDIVLVVNDPKKANIDSSAFQYYLHKLNRYRDRLNKSSCDIYELICKIFGSSSVNVGKKVQSMFKKAFIYA